MQLIMQGAGGAIGRAICLRLAKEGAKVSCLDVDESTAKETASLINGSGGTASFAAVDVSKEKAVKEVIDK